MKAAGSNPLESIRLIAAKYTLGLAHSWEVSPIADQALSDGLYSDALADLAAIADPTRAEVTPLLQRVTVELGLPTPSRVEAAWYLAHHCIHRIVSENEPPLVPLTLLNDVSFAAEDVLPNKRHVGDGLDLGSLIGLFWSYSAPNENYYEAEQRLITDEVERQALLDRLAREECRLWLARHSPSNQFENESPAGS